MLATNTQDLFHWMQGDLHFSKWDTGKLTEAFYAMSDADQVRLLVECATAKEAGHSFEDWFEDTFWLDGVFEDFLPKTTSKQERASSSPSDLGSKIDHLTQVMLAPTAIIRDENGTIVGSRKELS